VTQSPPGKRTTLQAMSMHAGIIQAAGILLLVLAPGAPSRAAEPVPDPLRAAPGTWVVLFDGRTLGGWRPSDFGGMPEQEVHVRNGCIELDFGAADLSGVTWTGNVPRLDYEIELEACRLAGNDFFCGLTFPYKDACCTLIVGGWGGSLVGLSSFDGLDASENETTRTMKFENGVWYHIRLRVRENRIEAWIGGRKVVDARPGGRKVAVRGEVESSRPLGIAAWNTRAALRNIRIRRLPTNSGSN